MKNKFKVIKYLKSINVDYIDVCLSERDGIAGSLFDPVELYVYIDKKQILSISRTLGLPRQDVELMYLLHEAGHALDFHNFRKECSLLLHRVDAESKMSLERRAWIFALAISDMLKLDISTFAFHSCRRHSLDDHKQYYAMREMRSKIGVA